MISPDRMLSQQQIYNFLRTVTVKFEPLASYQNATLIQKGYAVNDYDKTSWKYYLNMVGRYHAADTMMYVTSLDTRETILLSPENLTNHPRTKAAYVPGGLYYNRLCENYPDQVDLIGSILFPVDSIEKAILSPDLTMLTYGSGYLEPDEESVMVMKLHAFLKIIEERWYFNFLDDEPYFHITFWAGLWIHLAGFIMATRVEHIRTAYVHSFDVWNSLQDHGLDNYSDILNREKAMMLYQNIEYFKSNAGKEKNLLILAERLLGDLGIGLYGRMVVQESETGAQDYQLTPQLVPVRLSGKSHSTSASIEIKTVGVVQSEILDKGLTDSDSAETVKTVERKLGDTRLNEYGTKFLEIRPVAQNKPYADLLSNFLMETLFVSIIRGYYVKPVEIRDPLTKQLIYLSPKELLALYNYALHKARGEDLSQFPTSVSLFHSFNTTIGIPAKIIPYKGRKLYLSQVVDSNDYLSNLHYDRYIETPQEFTEQATRLWLRYMDHHLADQKTVIDKVGRAYQYLFDLCHTRRIEDIELVTGYSDYDSWLGATGINIIDTIVVQYNLQVDPKLHWSNLADTIITALIPVNETFKYFGNFTLSNSGYERLRQLFVQMCSYRVVFLQADRETDKHMAYSKWSTAYGPDDITQLVDYVIATQVNRVDSSLIIHDSYLYPGVHRDMVVKSDSPRRYTVTTTVTDAIHESIHKGDAVRPSLFHTHTDTVVRPLMLASSSLQLSKNIFA